MLSVWILLTFSCRLVLTPNGRYTIQPRASWSLKGCGDALRMLVRNNSVAGFGVAVLNTVSHAFHDINPKPKPPPMPEYYLLIGH